MRSLHVKHAATAAVLLALPVSVAACSSSSSPKAANSSPTAHSTSSAPAPSTSTDHSTDAGAKPTKAQVAAGMTNYFVAKGVPRSLVGGVATCVADKGYSQFSDNTLRALKNGRVTDLNPLDAGTLTKVTTTCLAAGSTTGVG